MPQRWSSGSCGDRPALHGSRLPGGSLPPSGPRTTPTARRHHPPLPTRSTDPYGMPAPRAPVSRESRPRLRLLSTCAALRAGPEPAGTSDSRRADPHPTRRRDSGDLAGKRHAQCRAPRPAPSRRHPRRMTAQIEPAHRTGRNRGHAQRTYLSRQQPIPACPLEARRPDLVPITIDGEPHLVPRKLVRAYATGVLRPGK